MQCPLPAPTTEHMAWMNGAELVYIKEHKTITYNFRLWFGAAVTGTGNVRFRVDVYKYHDAANMDKTTPDLSETSGDIAVTASTDRLEEVFSALIPNDGAAEEEQLLAISVSRIPAAVGEFSEAIDIYAASLEVVA